jgi:DNA-binding beta-propeller fold protein YncE
MNLWYISFHGGEEKHSRNNIHTYSETGIEVGKALNRRSMNGVAELRELRGFTFGPDGNLYVVNAYCEYSQILRFHGLPDAQGQHEFMDIFVDRRDSNHPVISHPFNITFGRRGNLFVSNQDTNVVARYYGPHSELDKPGSPVPIPGPLLHTTARLHPGIFVPSTRHLPDGVEVVRDILFGPDGTLYVADRDANAIRMYEHATGRYLGAIASERINKPVHLLLEPSQRGLLIGCSETGSIVRYDLADQKTTTLVTAGSCGLQGPAGMAFGDDGALYVASRLTKQVLRFKIGKRSAEGEIFIDGLEDNPEFVQLVRF